MAVGALIGGALKLGANIVGGIKQRKFRKQQENRINQQMQENQDWYDRAYNEDVTQRADALRLITMTQDAMRRNNQAAAGQAAVAGGTTESVAAARAANNEMLGDTVSQIAADAASRKDAIQQQYMANKAGLVGDLNDLDAQAMRNAAAGARSVGNIASSIGENLYDVLKKS